MDIYSKYKSNVSNIREFYDIKTGANTIESSQGDIMLTK